MALISIGANIGNPVDAVLRAVDRLADLSPEPILRSSLWRTAPVDCPPGTPPFVNAAVAIVPPPGETPESLLEKLLAIENDFGRTRPGRNAPRTLDLDLIAFGAETRQSAGLTLPHPRAHTRRFVLQPLAEIVPGFVIPGRNATIAELLASLAEGERIERLEQVSSAS
ncbi:MAG: 2-amino-4-hydroxy-6-hydroxymethyldihydropteridine diphosphokinase [Verrucomicrobiia bacterium]